MKSAHIADTVEVIVTSDAQYGTLHPLFRWFTIIDPQICTLPHYDSRVVTRLQDVTDDFAILAES